MISKRFSIGKNTEFPKLLYEIRAFLFAPENEAYLFFFILCAILPTLVKFTDSCRIRVIATLLSAIQLFARGKTPSHESLKLNCTHFDIWQGGTKMVTSGSMAAKGGFKMEKTVADKFNDWTNDAEAKVWLEAMGYDLAKIEFVKAIVIPIKYKTDVQVQITIKMKGAIDAQNIQVKLLSSKSGYNQVDKRWIKSYRELWDMPDDVVELLRYFSGELPPYKKGTKYRNRMIVSEFTDDQQKRLLSFFEDKKFLVLMDVIKGRGLYTPEWYLIVRKDGSGYKWAFMSINVVINHYCEGNVKISPGGSINIGRVTLQRKGGDKGADTANMLQFKVDPGELFYI